MEDLKRGDVVNGRYRVERVLGRGAMGTVYLVSDRQLLGATWALKMVSVAEMTPEEASEAVSLFERETELLTRLRHPGLPRVLDAFSDGPCHVLVMERIQGETLDDLMARRGIPFTENELLPTLQQLAACLQYLHSQKPHPIVFRDLKPSNCMVTGDGKVQLIDFGIARHYKPGRPSDTIVLGTPGFCAPEQYGNAQTEPRSDIYALGATAWHLLSGHDPTAVGFVFPPLRKVAPNCSMIMEGILARCLAVDAAARYPTAADLLADLEYAASPEAMRQELERRRQEMLAAAAPAGSPAPAPGSSRAHPVATFRARPTVRVGSRSPIHLPRILAGNVPLPFQSVRPSRRGVRAAPFLRYPLETTPEAFLASWGRRTFQVWWGPGSIHLPRILALMLLMFFLLPFITMVAQSQALRTEVRQEHPVGAISPHSYNLAVLRRSLEQYFITHGRYPERLDLALRGSPPGPALACSSPANSPLADPPPVEYESLCGGRSYRLSFVGQRCPSDEPTRCDDELPCRGPEGSAP